MAGSFTAASMTDITALSAVNDFFSRILFFFASIVNVTRTVAVQTAFKAELNSLV